MPDEQPAGPGRRRSGAASRRPPRRTAEMRSTVTAARSQPWQPARRRRSGLRGGRGPGSRALGRRRRLWRQRSPAPAATVTVTASPSGSPGVSASASPRRVRPAPQSTAQLVVAVAGGPKANGISVVSSTGQVKQLVAPSGGPISDLSWAPDGVRLAFLRAVSASDSDQEPLRLQRAEEAPLPGRRRHRAGRHRQLRLGRRDRSSSSRTFRSAP